MGRGFGNKFKRCINYIMKKELITFKTAKLAKDKGFDVYVCDMYASNGVITKFSKTKILLYADYTLAPAQSLLQKWLRDRHNIDFWFGILENNQYHIEDITRNGVLIGSCVDGHDSYEDALEVGLQEALKLIN